MALSSGLNKSLNSLTTECYGIWYRDLDTFSFESGDASKFHSIVWNSTPYILYPFSSKKSIWTEIILQKALIFLFSSDPKCSRILLMTNRGHLCIKIWVIT